MKPTYTTGNVVTAGAMAASIVSLIQLAVELIAPDALWQLVQTKTQAWAGLQVILSFGLLRFRKRWFTGEEAA